ncbi:MAG: zinc ribbon domain-containing protein [Desulfobacterota bacterium]|nr:zinc ribbon domain-containing protein [Thermodesulfobacteriota bacterium]
MPIYEYRCRTCKKKFDVVVLRASERGSPRCESCGSTDVAKLVSRVRYLAGPRETELADNTERRLLKRFGKNVDEGMRKQIKELAKTAAKRGKRRFESMMDTGSSESIEY